MIGDWDPDAAPAGWTSWSEVVTDTADVARQVREVGPMIPAGAAGSERSRELWLARVAEIDGIAADVQRDALADGADPGWVEDGRLLGIQAAIDPDPPVWRWRPARQHPTEAFFIDLLHIDLWHLERAAALQLAYGERVRYQSGSGRADLDREQALFDRMDLRQRRASGVVAGARITAEESEQLWGAGAEQMRRMHACAVSRMSEAELREMWNEYADAHVPLLLPPYLYTDPATGKPLRPTLTELPSTDEILAQAAATQRARRAEDTDQPGTDSTIADAVQATNPGSHRDPEPWTSHDGKPEPEPELRRADPVSDRGLEQGGRDE
ncbi:hypothetical protein ACFU44_06020 [Nocardia rhizosphaerihabitans]|uniref:hypothetical protein n=1 Tax=Nocardia rhizosphaerihabitans TaxID=1691570 RepID=UPI00366E59E5